MCVAPPHPVVVAGTSALNPYDKWTTAVAADDDIVAVCESAVARPIERLAEPARDEVRRRLADHPGMAEQADVVVHRANGQLDATITLPGHVDDLDGALAVAVAGVLRAHDRYASRVNVAVRRDD